MSSENEKQNIEIAKINKEVCFVKKEVIEIKEQVFNHIPTEIKGFRNEFQEYRLSNSKWLVGILVALVLTLIGTILNLLS